MPVGSMGNPWQTTYHTLMVAWYLMADLYLAAIVLVMCISRWDVIFSQFGAGIQYFTMWNFVAQQMYFILSLKEDLMPSSCDIKHSLRKFLTLAFHALIFPLGLIVAIDFWVIYKIDPTLLDPYSILNGLMSTLNHGVHSTIVPIVLLELVIADRPRKSITLTDTFVHLVFLHMVYLTVIYVLYYFGEVWPYPFLNYLNFTQKLVLAVLNSAVGTLVASAGYAAKTNIQTALQMIVKII